MTPALPKAPKNARRTWGDTLVLVALFLVLSLSLRQETFYLFDGHNMVMRLSRLSPASALHPFPDILGQWVSRLLRSGLFGGLELRPFAILGALSGVGMAVAVGLAHRLFLSLGMGRVRAGLGALLFGSTPNVLFFATVIEVHGIFLPFAVAGLWAITAFARRGGILLFLLAAFLCGFASFVHSSMHVLLPFYLLWMDAFAAERDGQAGSRNWKRRLGRAFAFSVAYGAFAFGTRMGFSLAGLLAAAPAKESAQNLSQSLFGLEGLTQRLGPLLAWPLGQLKGRSWGDLPYLLLTPLREWVLPALPVSVAFVFAWRKKALIPLVRNLLIGLVILSLVAYLMLNRFVEYGAYFLPLVVPAAYLAAKSLPKPAIILLIFFGFIGGISWVRVHDKRPFEESARYYAELEREQGKLLVLADWLTDPVFLGGIHAFRRSQIWFLQEFGIDQLPPAVLPSLVGRLRSMGKGEEVPARILLTEKAIGWMKAKKGAPTRELLLRALRLGFKWKKVNNGFLLQPKGD